MKIRVKSVATGQVTIVDADGALADLHSAIGAALGISASDVRVSLNKKAVLEGEGSLYGDFGLRAGETLWLMDAGDAPAASASAAAAPTGPSAPRPSSGGIPIGQGAAQLASAPPAASAAASERERALDETLACAAAVLESAKASNALEYLTVLLHAVMVEAGFAAQRPEPSGMPAAWRQAPGFYALDYTHTRYSAAAYADTASSPPVAQLKAFGMGEQGAAGPSLLVVQAVVTHAGDSALFSCQLRTHELLDASAIAGELGPEVWAALSTLAAPARFVHQVRVHVVAQLLGQLRASCERPRLVELCGELRAAMLRHLDARSLARVGAVCRELREAAADEELWRELCKADFGRGGKPAGGWRGAYAQEVRHARTQQAALVRARAEELARRAEWERIYRDGPARPNHPMPFGGPFPPNGFPGMLGGDYDRLPGGLSPNSFGDLPGIGPLGSGRGGHFGDPDGPLPPGAVPPGVRYDPIHPDFGMDIDGGFGGGGGWPTPGPGFPGRGRMGPSGRGLHPDLPDPSRFY
ncbi:hypothetical protein T492DRAFT_911606 [Pavlovales sp. CCMP2436]|nr:hypothetical protein T492DRAFT_911606 [Pavlovales sp. CCMP2436]